VLLETTLSGLCKKWEKGRHLGSFSRTLILLIKSSLGLDCRNTGRLYTGTAAHGPWSLKYVHLVKRGLSVSYGTPRTSAAVCMSRTIENEQEQMIK